jgi:CBS domain containing-hemolysin-like protein
VRATESAEALLERMQARHVPAVLVATAKGRLLGLAYQEDLRELVAGKESLSRLDRRFPSDRRNRLPR